MLNLLLFFLIFAPYDAKLLIELILFTVGFLQFRKWKCVLAFLLDWGINCWLLAHSGHT